MEFSGPTTFVNYNHSARVWKMNHNNTENCAKIAVSFNIESKCPNIQSYGHGAVFDYGL